MAAVSAQGQALRHVDETLQSDKEVVLAAASTWGSAVTCASEALRKNTTFMLDAVRKRFDSLQGAKAGSPWNSMTL